MVDSQVAQHATQQACHRLEPHSSPPRSPIPRLLDLPQELRLHILKYTDLVTPWKEVMWTRLERGDHSPSRDPTPSQNPTSSPTSLFLVCRTLAKDARFVFFSQNHFVVSDTLASLNPYQAFNIPRSQWFQLGRGQSHTPPPPTTPRPSACSAQRLAASQFLRDVVPAGCLGHLRFVEFIFPPYNYQCWPEDGHPALQDWAETINWAKTELSVPSLTLRLTMAGTRDWPPQPPDERGEVSQEQGDEVLAGYHRILRPLACLREHDLSHFYADFAWPWEWTSFADDGSQEDIREWIKLNQDRMNEDAERFILGDRYGQVSRKEKREEERPWQLNFICEY